jgi:hypothetical protein
MLRFMSETAQIWQTHFHSFMPSMSGNFEYQTIELGFTTNSRVNKCITFDRSASNKNLWFGDVTFSASHPLQKNLFYGGIMQAEYHTSSIVLNPILET